MDNSKSLWRTESGREKTRTTDIQVSMVTNESFNKTVLPHLKNSTSVHIVKDKPMYSVEPLSERKSYQTFYNENQR